MASDALNIAGTANSIPVIPGVDGSAGAGASFPKEKKGKGRGRGRGRQEQEHWSDRDARFRRSLPDATYVKRMAYRGVIMRLCPHLQILDGIVILAKERKKAEMLLQGLEDV